MSDSIESEWSFADESKRNESVSDTVDLEEVEVVEIEDAEAEQKEQELEVKKDAEQAAAVEKNGTKIGDPIRDNSTKSAIFLVIALALMCGSLILFIERSTWKNGTTDTHTVEWSVKPLTSTEEKCLFLGFDQYKLDPDCNVHWKMSVGLDAAAASSDNVNVKADTNWIEEITGMVNLATNAVHLGMFICFVILACSMVGFCRQGERKRLNQQEITPKEEVEGLEGIQDGLVEECHEMMADMDIMNEETETAEKQVKALTEQVESLKKQLVDALEASNKEEEMTNNQLKCVSALANKLRDQVQQKEEVIRNLEETVASLRMEARAPNTNGQQKQQQPQEAQAPHGQLKQQQPQIDESLTTGATTNEHKEEKLKLIQQQLLVMLHTNKCLKRDKAARNSDRQPVPCTLPHCNTMKDVMSHMTSCTEGRSCKYSHCASTRALKEHFTTCEKDDCPICGPIKKGPSNKPVVTLTALPTDTVKTEDGASANEEEDLPLFRSDEDGQSD